MTVGPRALAFALLTALAGATGCDHAGRGPADPSDLGPELAAVRVSDRMFATSVHRLLREGEPSNERSALLAGTVKRQLAHAAERFAAGDDVRGADAVVGALYLVRAGEMRDDMFDKTSIVALDGALRRFSAVGDEGRAQALLVMQTTLLPKKSKRRAELAEHKRALDRWIADTRVAGGMPRLGAEERAAVGNALLDPSEAALRRAEKAINRWVARAIDINLTYQRTRKSPPRTDVVEAYSALQLGSETMAAVFLRHGRVAEALLAIEEGPTGRIVASELFARVRSTALEGRAEDWRLLARELAERAQADDDVQMDQALLDAALWGIALEAYRRDPTSYTVAHLLARQLVSLGIPEAAPLVLEDALGPDPTTVALAGVTTVISSALNERFGIGDAKTARRIFAAAAGVMRLADAPRFARRLHPSAADVRALMGTIELHAGNADAALPLMASAVKASPTVAGYIELALVERQAGRVDDALADLGRATRVEGATEWPLRTAEAHLLSFELLNEKGAQEAASAELARALEITLAARGRGSVENQLGAERLLARVLDAYGDRDAASRATARALALAEKAPAELGATVREAIGRALVYRDLDGARAALYAAVSAQANADDQLYGALWLMLLEDDLDESPDGKADRVLVAAVDAGGWLGALAAWARKTKSDAALRAAAKSHAERLEADFYIAMRGRARHDGQTTFDDQLRRIGRDPLHWQDEVRLARAILSPKTHADVPERFALP